MQTGDILLFKGKGFFSGLIMAAPGADYSHVGMYVEHPIYGPCVFESTSLGVLPDMLTGERINGVQLVPLANRVDGYVGEVYCRPIIGERTQEQLQGVWDFITKHHGKPYEQHTLQLVRAELDIFPWQRNKPDDSSLFCSETFFMCVQDARLAIDDGTPPNERTPTDCSDDHLVLVDGLELGDIQQLT